MQLTHHMEGTASLHQPTAFSGCMRSCSMQKGQLILYGGEWFDGAADKTYVYGDLYLYDTGKNRWKKVITPNGCGVCVHKPLGWSLLGAMN